MRLLRWTLVTTGTLLAALSLIWWLARPPIPGPFYGSDQIAASATVVLRSEPYLVGIPAEANARLILYRTTRGDGSQIIGSAIVVVPTGSTNRPRSTIAWAHGTTGIANGCAPSLSRNPFANMPPLDVLIRRGWAMVAADYPGLGTQGPHAYMVGEDAARSILDAVRAAASITDLRLSRETVIWGHSQGGHAALFTGSRALEYAPDVIVRGVVAMAPATDLVELVRRAQSSMFGKIVSSYLVRAYASRFPDVSLDTYITAINRIAVNDIASRCVGGWETLVSLGQTLILPSEGIFATDPTQGRLGARLRENTPLGVIASPVLIAQGDRDDLVFPDLQQSYVLARCATGQAIDYRVYAGRDHISLVNSDSPAVRAAVEWVEDRFQGRPFTANCPGMGGR